MPYIPAIDPTIYFPLYSNHSQYNGSFDEYGQKHGKNTKTEYSDGASYEGDWVHGLKEGQGKLTLPSGYSYQGGWQEDFYHGKGTEKLTDGEIIEANFVMGVKEGDAVVIQANDRTMKVTYHSNIMVVNSTGKPLLQTDFMKPDIISSVMIYIGSSTALMLKVYMPESNLVYYSLILIVFGYFL